jgi:two-component system sensor histidine kinase BaeS
VSSRRVPIRHSLVTRLLVTSMLIAIAAIAATAWLATLTATRAISQAQGQSLTDDKRVYDLLIEYAATHPDWSQVLPLIRSRAADLDRRITLMTEDRVVIADTGTGPSLRTARPSVVLDPLNLDLGLTGGTNRIDERVVGPFLVPPAERDLLGKVASDELSCLRSNGVNGKIKEQPNGRPKVTLTTPDPEGVASGCHAQLASVVTATERKALRSLVRRSAACLGPKLTARLQIRPDFSTYLGKSQDGAVVKTPVGETEPRAPQDAANTARATSCVEKARRAQLQRYVAPAALLFVTAPDTGADDTTFTLSHENTTRIVAVTGAVLAATLLITVLVGRRLVRPLRALTEAADRHAPAEVSTQDEIGRLARALNESNARRDRAEAQRRAMVSDVAHELRTPLSNIRSWLEAAQDDLTPTDADLLELLHEEAILLQHVIEDLGDLAAADTGTLRIHPEPTDVRDVLAQVVDGHRGTAQAGGVRLEMQITADPVLTADAVRLRQLVGNLVSNAIRHTPPGGTVTVGAHDTTITVKDTGSGISAEDLPRVFDRFWRADASRARRTGGTGLGLAIVQQLTHAHGGTISVESTVGQGSLFTVQLPKTADDHR